MEGMCLLKSQVGCDCPTRDTRDIWAENMQRASERCSYGAKRRIGVHLLHENTISTGRHFLVRTRVLHRRGRLSKQTLVGLVRIQHGGLNPSSD